MKMTIKQLWKIAKANNQPLLGTSTDLASLDFMEGYLAKVDAFDRDIARNRGFFSYTEDKEEDDTDLEYFQMWQKDVYYFLLKNEENYKRLYALLSIEYEPLQNYDKTSEITDQESGSDTDTNTIGARHREEDYAQKQNTNAYGAVSETDILGQRQDSTVYGARSETDSIGQKVTDTLYGAKSETTSHGAQSETYTYAQKENTNAYGATSETTTHGAKTTTQTDKVSGFNSAEFQDSTEGTTAEGQQQDTTAALAHTDTLTEGAHNDGKSTTQYDDGFTTLAHTDSVTEGAQSNSHTAQTYTDTDTTGTQTNTHSEVAKTDTITEGAHKDKFDEDQAIDTLQKAYGHKNTHNEHTFGNIGVTTSQQMALSEVDLWNSFKFYEILFGDIVKELCHFYDEGYDCF